MKVSQNAKHSTDKTADKFWDEVYEELAKESTVASAWKYFNEIDIENFKSTNIPMTSYKRDLIYDEKRSSVVFLENWEATQELTTAQLYREYETYCFNNNMTKITDRKFYRDITDMTQKNIIKTRMKDGYKLVSKSHTPLEVA